MMIFFNYINSGQEYYKNRCFKFIYKICKWAETKARFYPSIFLWWIVIKPRWKEEFSRSQKVSTTHNWWGNINQYIRRGHVSHHQLPVMKICWTAFKMSGFIWNTRPIYIIEEDLHEHSRMFVIFEGLV